MKQILAIILLCTSFLVGCNSDKVFNETMEMGKAALTHGKYESALEYFESALEKKKDDELANTLYSQTEYFINGLNYYESSDYNNAIDTFTKVTTYANGSELLLDKAEENIVNIQKAKELEDNIKIQINSAKDYYSNKEYEQSLSSIQSALNLIGDNDKYKSEIEYLTELKNNCNKSIEEIKLQQEEARKKLEEETRKKLELEKKNNESKNNNSTISESQAIDILGKYISNQIGYTPNYIEVSETINGKYHLNVNNYDENGMRETFGWYWVNMSTGEVSR